MNKFSTEYITKRDGGIVYSYDAEWFRTGPNVHWQAKVRTNSGFAGELAGIIEGADKIMNAHARVLELIEGSIEDRLGVS